MRNTRWSKSFITTCPQLSACIRLVTLPETNSSHLKMNPWKRRFLLETIIFRCELLVLGRVLALSLVAEPLAHRWIHPRLLTFNCWITVASYLKHLIRPWNWAGSRVCSWHYFAGIKWRHQKTTSGTSREEPSFSGSVSWHQPISTKMEGIQPTTSLFCLRSVRTDGTDACNRELCCLNRQAAGLGFSR